MKGWRADTGRRLNTLWYGHSPLRWLLWPLALLFGGLTRIRRMAFRRGWLRSTRLPVPVVVVGNLTVGGTGKTPLTIWLALALGERGHRVGIVCRGYGGAAEHWPQRVDATSDASRVGDEPVLLAARTGCPVVAGPDRVAAARALLDSAAVDVIVLDDGLQHYRLQRDFEIAVIDGTRGFGNGLCLPAGPLREPASRLDTVDAIVVNQGDFGHAGVLRAGMRATRVVELATGAERRLADFSGQSVHAVAALGNPDRFFDALRDAGLTVDAHAFPDHAALTDSDLGFTDGLPVLMTEKDAVKWTDQNRAGLWYVESALEFSGGDGERLLQMLTRQLERQQAPT